MLSVLNCTMGDMKFSFDSNDQQEVERARRCVQDMLKRGYILFVETEGGLRKVKRFDPKTDSYIIADGPTSQPVKEAHDEDGEEKIKKPATPRATERSLPAKRTKATAIAPTSGG